MLFFSRVENVRSSVYPEVVLKARNKVKAN